MRNSTTEDTVVNTDQRFSDIKGFSHHNALQSFTNHRSTKNEVNSTAISAF